MNLSKLTSVVKSKYTHIDMLGNNISIGDIVAVACHKDVMLGVVYNMNKKYISIYDKDALEEGETITLGRGVTGDQILIVNKLFSNDMQKNIEENKNNVIKQKTIEKKNNLPPKYVLTFLYKDENDYGIYILPCKKQGLKYFNESFNMLKEKYNEYKIFYYSSIKDEFIDQVNLKDISFFNTSSIIFTNQLSFDIRDKFIKLYYKNNRYNFCIKIDEYNDYIKKNRYGNYEVFIDMIENYKTIEVVHNEWRYNYTVLFTGGAYFNNEENFIKIINNILKNIN